MRAPLARFTTPRVSTLVLGLLLAACGGNDTATGETPIGEGLGPALTIDDNNYVQVGGRAAKGSLDAASLVQGLDAAGSRTVSKAGSTSQSAQQPTVSNALQHLAWARATFSSDDVGGALKGTAHLAAGGSRTIGCSGGGNVTLTTTVVSTDSDSVGDRWLLAYDRCVDLLSRVYTDGSVGFEFTRVGAGRLWRGAPYDLSFRVTFSSLVTVDPSVGRSTTHGEMALSTQRSESQVGRDAVSTPLLETTSTTRSLQQRHVLADFAAATTHSRASEAFTVDGFASADDVAFRSVRAVTLAPMVRLRGDAYPSSGAFQFTGDAGARVTMTALDATRVRFDLDRNGDGIVDTSSVVNWSSLW